MEELIIFGRIANKLSVDDKFSNAIYNKFMIEMEQYGVASKRNYYMRFDLTKSGTRYTLKSAHSYFNQISDNSFNEALNEKIIECQSTGALSKEEKKYITTAFRELVDDDKPSHLFALGSLIKKYSQCFIANENCDERSNKKYNYLLIPVLVDCGLDPYMVHQCAIIVSYKTNEFIFYEPYGTYLKYGARYDLPMMDFMQIYNQIFDAKFTTFHDKFEIQNVAEHLNARGIQSIILTYNNLRVDEFKKERDEMLDLLSDPKYKSFVATLKNTLNAKSKLVETDYTCNIIDTIDDFKYNKKYFQDDEKFMEAWDKNYYLYAKYNSKTCVSITLVELYNFFINSNENTATDTNSTKIAVGDFIERYAMTLLNFENPETPIPNIILADDLKKLLQIICNYEKLLETINSC
jgi:hypothetical protein